MPTTCDYDCMCPEQRKAPSVIRVKVTNERHYDNSAERNTLDQHHNTKEATDKYHYITDTVS